MKIEDYKNAVSRMHVRSELKTEVIKMSEKKNNKRFTKKTAVPLAIAAAVCLMSFTFVFADDIARIFRKSDNFEMNIPTEQYISEDISSVSVKSAVLKKWDENTIKNLFFSGKEIINSDEYQSDLNPEKTRKVYDFDDGSSLAYEDGDLYWKYGDWYNYSYSYPVSVFKNNNYDKTSGEVIFRDGDINGLDKSECIALADSYVNQLGINVKDRKSYALDKESLIKIDTCRNENGERIYKHGEVLPEWTEQQEAYLIVYDVCIDELSLDGFDSIYEVIVGRNGLVHFEFRYIYESTDDLENADICSAEQAADSIYGYFNKSTPASPTEIENCRLVYVPEWDNDKYILKPYWEFYSTEFSSWLTDSGTIEDFEYNDRLIVDAQTGKFDIEKNLMNINIYP